MFSFSATIDRFENGYAILRTEDKLEIQMPKSKLPKEAKEGSLVRFEIYLDAEGTKRKEELAKEILNQILNPKHQITNKSQIINPKSQTF